MTTSIDREDSKRLMVFAGSASQELGTRIASRLGIELGDVDLRTFANGELYVRFNESIRGADVFLVQSTCRPVNDSLMELLIMINAAKLASAHRITAVIPWYGYSRQDKKSAPREPVTSQARRRPAPGGRGRPGADHGPARRPGPGLLQRARSTT